MKRTSSFFVGIALMLSCGALPQLASAQPRVAAPDAPAPIPLTVAPLEIQISAPVKKDGGRSLLLDPVQPHFSVILRNAWDKPIPIFEEWNSWGFYNLHLEITAVDGKVLTKPLIVRKGSKAWFANLASTEILAPNQAIVREIYLHVPAEIRHPKTPATLEEGTNDLNPDGDSYWFFPFPKKSARNTVTMKAVYEVDSKRVPIFGVWTGRIESAPLTYEIGWGAPRR